MAWTVEQICEHLEAHRQRATYGAVAEVLLGDEKKAAAAGRLIRERARAPRYSWVVRAGDGLPSKYASHERHPELESNPEVIKTDLEVWLAMHPLPTPAAALSATPPDALEGAEAAGEASDMFVLLDQATPDLEPPPALEQEKDLVSDGEPEPLSPDEALELLEELLNRRYDGG